MSSPYADDARAVMAARLAGDIGGGLLACYASVRSTVRLPDALVGLGLPLVGYVLASTEDPPVRVTAVHGHHTASDPVWGLATGVDLWTVLIRCASGMTITLDVGAGPWTTGAGPLDLRVEWMGRESVVALHPRGATITTADPGDASLGLSGLEERLLAYAEEICDRAVEGTLPPELGPAMRIIEAAVASVASGAPADV